MSKRDKFNGIVAIPYYERILWRACFIRAGISARRRGTVKQNENPFLFLAETVYRGIRENAGQMAANRISSQVKNADFIGSDTLDVTMMQQKNTDAV